MSTGLGHAILVSAVAGGALAVGGCSRDVRLDDHKVRTVTVRSVNHYGEVLDRTASPEKAAYVALRAIRDDFYAATKQDREKALDVQFDVCAANELARLNRGGLSRDERIFNVVYHWTPTVSHYVANFPATWDEAQTRLVQRKTEPILDHPKGAKRCELAMEVDDPGGDPDARIVLLVWLVEDDGFWRVTHFGFDRTRRSLNGTAQASAKP